MVTRPYPGSDEAIQQGCTCPVLDNRHGQGYYAGPDGTFVMVEDCPLHGYDFKAATHAAEQRTTPSAPPAKQDDTNRTRSLHCLSVICTCGFSNDFMIKYESV